MSRDSIKQRVCADVAAGKPYLRVSADHGVSAGTARRWFAESGLSRSDASPTRAPVTQDKREAIARLLRAGVSGNEIRRQLKCGAKTVRAVQREVTSV